MSDSKTDDTFKPLNLREIAENYGIKHAPGFIIKYYEKLLHIKEINEFVGQHWNDNAQDYLNSLVNHLDLHGIFSGPGYKDINNYAGKQIMVVSNHPIGGAESNLCLSNLYAIDPNMKLLAAELYSKIKPMHQCCVFNKRQVRTLYDSIEQGNSLLMYPAGACSRKLSFGDVFDYRWKKGFIKMVKKYNIPLVVCFTSGQASNRYLNFTKVRKFFHINTVAEASFLPDEMFRKTGATLNFTFGKIIDPSVFNDSISDQEWADRIRQYCYSLKTNPDSVFNPDKEATLPLE